MNQVEDKKCAFCNEKLVNYKKGYPYCDETCRRLKRQLDAQEAQKERNHINAAHAQGDIHKKNDAIRGEE